MNDIINLIIKFVIIELLGVLVIMYCGNLLSEASILKDSIGTIQMNSFEVDSIMESDIIPQNRT